MKARTTILPNGNEKCGLLNDLYSINEANQMIIVQENYHSNPFIGRIQTIFNCSHNSDWASSSSTPYVEFKLLYHLIRSTNITISRRTVCAYANQVVLETQSSSGWTPICSGSITYTNPSETKTIPCISDKFYSSFRIRQISNSDSISYMELSSFDIFGYMIVSNPFNISCENTNIISIFVGIVLFIIK